MRRITILLGTLAALLVSALPTFASEGDPLAESILVPGWFALAMVGLAVLLILIFAGLARRGVGH
ncbi:MAG: hypothetical protein R3C44_10245 [Chloroflexota bacterium]